MQIGGRRIGSVKKIELTDDNQAEVTIDVEEPYAPLHEGTTAIIRLTSLSGVANRYVALSPGPNNAPELQDGAVHPARQDDHGRRPRPALQHVRPERPRKGLQDVIQGFGD